MNKHNLPYISIKGDTIQQLIEIEMILVMLGYDEPDEKWNNSVCYAYSLDNRPILEMHLSGSTRKIIYFKWYDMSAFSQTVFHATDIDGIINYVEWYKKGNK